MIRYVRAHMVWSYILSACGKVPGKNWGAAYDVARREEDQAFQALLDIAYPLVRPKGTW